MEKVLRFKARKASPPGIPSMIFDKKGGYVRYKDYLKLKHDLKIAIRLAEEAEDARLDAINPCC